MKPFLIALITFFFIHPVAHARGGNDKAKQQMEEKKKELEKARADREKRTKGVQEFMKTKDTNHDGSLSREEYCAGESDAAAAGKKFDEANKNGDRALSKSKIAVMLGL